MKTVHKLAVASLVAATAAIGASAPAAAHVDVSVGVGVGVPPPLPGPAFDGPGVFVGDYDYYRPCAWYRYWNIPAPGRCYREFIGFYGPHLYVVDGFVFRDHGDWERWHDRDDWEHWRAHDFHRADWHDNGLHKGWYKHHHDEDEDEDRGHRGDRDDD